MKIIPLPENIPLSLDNWFKKGLDEFMKELNKRLTDDYPGRCELSCYYFDGPSYTKAIWIKVYNVNKVDVWIRVGFNEFDKKKVNVYSECELGCMNWTYVATYALPLTFSPNGVWMTDKGKIVRNVSWADLMDELISYLKCLCFGLCKKIK